MKYEKMVDDKRRAAFIQLIETIDANIPKGFEKIEEYGGVGYVVPLSIYPQGYHVTPGKPLPFINVIAQKTILHFTIRNLCQSRLARMV